MCDFYFVSFSVHAFLSFTQLSSNGAASAAKRIKRCGKCDITFSSNAEFWRHRHKVHPRPKKRVVCWICGKRVLAPYLSQHESEIHAREHCYSCSYCPKGFFNKGAMRQHERQFHRKEGRVSCSVCEKIFTGKQGLQRHADAVHRGLKPFTCSYCTQCFAQQHTAERHERTVHSYERARIFM